jgi:hypothetical protein
LARRLDTTGLLLAVVTMTHIRVIQRCIRVKLTLLRCASAELLFSCCGIVTAPRATTWEPRSITLRQTTRGAAGIGLGTTAKDLRRTMSAAAGNGLGTALSYLRGAAGNGRAQRSSACDAQRAPSRATDWAPR